MGRQMKRLLVTATLLASIGNAYAQELPKFAADSRFTIDGSYWRSWAYDNINVQAAWKFNANRVATGYTGKNVTVAVFDSGLDVNNSKFAGNTVRGWNLYGNNGNGSVGVTGDNNWHGTFVSSIIGANTSTPSNPTMYGVAPNAKIMPIQIIDANGAGNFTDGQLAKAINFATSGGARVFNNSWNHSQTLAELGTTGAAGLRTSLPQEITAWQNAVTKGALIVFAAGNYGKVDPGYYGTMPHVSSGLGRNWITTIATDQTGAKADFSNGCGIAWAYCMAAPGSGIVGIYKNTLGVGSGTSFAAPIVSAAAALLYEKWPSLKGADIQKILFDTADKTGIYADKTVYGQGMLNLTKAFAPVGTVKIAANSPTVNGPTIALQSSTITASPAFGTAVQNALSNVDVMVLDDYKRDYSANLGSITSVQNNSLNYWGNQLAVFGSQEYQDGDGTTTWTGSANDLVAGFSTTYTDPLESDSKISSGSGSFSVSTARGNSSSGTVPKSSSRTFSTVGINASPSYGYGPFGNASIKPNDLVLINSVGNPYMNMAPNSNSAGITHKWDNGSSTRFGMFSNSISYNNIYNNIMNTFPTMTGFNVEHTVNLGRAYASISGGMVNESNTVLGSYSSGSLNLGTSARTTFAGFTTGYKLTDTISAFAGGTVGYTVTSTDPNSLIKKVRNLTSSNTYTGIVKTGIFTTLDRFGVVLGLPLRVNTGVFDMSIPTARDIDGNILYSNRSVALGTNKIEYNLQAFYNTPLTDSSSVGLGVGKRFNVTDLGTNNTETIGMVRYNLRF